MGRNLRSFVGVLKEKAMFASPPFSASAADLAVLRATSHYRPSSPPRPHHIAALLSFGRGARPAASALSAALFSRLLSTRDPSVALKSLLSLHLLLRTAPFILLDALSSALLPNPSGRHTRSPLLLSSFPLGHDPLSWSLSSWVRWYAGLLELRLLLPDPTSDLTDWLSSLLTCDLLTELDSLAKFLAEAYCPPEMPPGNRLVAEVERAVANDILTAENWILARLREVRERIGSVGIGNAIELICVLRHIQEHQPSDARWTVEENCRLFWKEVKEAREMAEEVVIRMGKEGRVVRREPTGSVSDRFGVRSGMLVQFGSNRWVGN